MKKLYEQLKNLEGEKLEAIILLLMRDETLSYTRLSNLFVQTLLEKEKEQRVIISGLTIPLSQYVEDDKRKTKHSIFIRAKSAYNMIKTYCFRDTEFEKKLKEMVDKVGYIEDENGHHSITYKKYIV